MASNGEVEGITGADPDAVDDLEQYGVWVKTAPEDVADELMDDVEDEASQLTTEEEELLAPLESESQQENASDTATDDFADINLDDIEDISLDDLDDEATDELGAGSPVLSDEESGDVDFDVDALDLDLDDLEVEEEAGGEPATDEPAAGPESQADAGASSDESEGVEPFDLGDEEEIALDLDDMDLADIEGPELETEESVSEEGESEEVASDQAEEIGDFELEDISLPTDQEDLDLDDGPESTESLPELELEEEDLDLELIEEEPEPAVADAAEPDAQSSGDFDDLHAVDDLAAVESELTETGEPDTEEFGTEDLDPDRDDIANVGGSSEGETAAAVSPSSSETATPDDSVLAKIEGELSAIKRELTDLRQELSVLRTRNAQLESTATEAPEEAASIPAAAAEDESAGFFEEEDEDETIALTGAELDNILNTAEFTEEDGEPTEIDDSDIDYMEAETEEEPEDELLDLEIEEPAEDIGIGGESVDMETDAAEPDTTEPDTTEAETPEADIDLEAEEGVEDFEATLGYSDQVPLSPEIEGQRADDERSEEELAEVERAGDSLADRETEPEEEEIELGLEEDIIPLEAEPAPTTEDISFEDTEQGAQQTELPEAPIEEIELEELDEEESEEPDDATAESIPSLDELEQDDGSLSDDDGALPDLDIDAELADIGELSDEPEELPESDEPLGTQPSFEGEPLSPSQRPPAAEVVEPTGSALGEDLKGEIRSVLSYMDQLLESLPEEKIEEFARSEHFEVYRKLFEELGLER